MTNVSDIYTLWLKPHHLPVGKAVEVTIEKVEKRTIHPRPTEEKEALILTFAGRNRKMILNPTNANKMTDIGGEDYSAWRGLVIQLKRAQHTKDKETIHVIPASKIEVPPVVKEAVKPASDKATEPVTLPEPQPAKANGDKPLAEAPRLSRPTGSPLGDTLGDNGHTEKPATKPANGAKKKIADDPMSQYWLAVGEAEISKQEGKRILDGESGDAVKALNALKGISQVTPEDKGA